MAVVSVWSAVSKKSHKHTDITGIRQIERETTEYYLPSRTVSRCFSLSLLGDSQRKWIVSPHGSQLNLKASRRQKAFACGQASNRRTQLKTRVGIPLPKAYNKDSHGKRHSRGSGFYALATDSSQEQLKTLDSYFSKLHNDMDEQFTCRNDSDVEENHMKSLVLEGKGRGSSTTSSNKYRRKTTLDSLENYFEELNTGGGTKNGTSPTVDQEFLERPIRRPNSVFHGYLGKQRMPIEVDNFEQFKSMDDEANEVVFGNESIQGVQRYDDEASDFYLINLLVAINIAVFLFEIASPVLNSELEQLSLPLIYGAKINELILGGEWWRLLTPMFLVQD